MSRATSEDFVYLAYLDDSNTKSKSKTWQVMAGVLIEDRAFNTLEAGMGGVKHDLTELIPEDRRLEEFHACELYGGYKAFEGIEQEERFEAIRRILFFLDYLKLSVVYTGVDVVMLQKMANASANPLDIAFRGCVDCIRRWFTSRRLARASLGEPSDVVQSLVNSWLEDLVILIVDDCDKSTKHTLQTTFRSVRQGNESNPLHDDMYFGDSRYSIGIQLADLCAYFIAKHLMGDTETQSFYDMIEPHIAFSETHPGLPAIGIERR